MTNPGSDILRTFRRRLTNLSSRNRSLLLTNLPIGQFLDLHETDFLLNKPSFTILADLIGRKAVVPVCDVLDARQERSNEVSRKLRRIDRTARFIEDERGTEDLYVGWPFVRGKFLDNTVVHGPLLFFPVELVQQGRHWKLAGRGDVGSFLNPTLLLAYQQFNSLTIPDDVFEKSTDDFDHDPLVFRTQLYEWLKTTPLELNFNQELFADKLQFFDKQNARSLDQLERTGELKLYPEAVLGIFPQAGSFLVPDYDALLTDDRLTMSDEWLPRNEDSSLIAHHSSLKERQILTPLPLDASQEATLRAVKAGQSLAVQGPPGTGKSQLIANLMADAAAAGKRVLLVCQKRAALDVVQERLRQVGMESFLALVHDFQDDRPALYAQIARQIEQIDAYRQQNNSLNAVLLERDFDTESRRIDAIVAELQTFKDALFDTSICGISAKELYLTSQPNAPTIDVSDTYTAFQLSNIDGITRRLSDYAAYRQRLGSEHPWTDRKRFDTLGPADLSKLTDAIATWAQTRQQTDAQTAALLGQSIALQRLMNWNFAASEVVTLLRLLDEPDANELWAVVLVLRANARHPALMIELEQLPKLSSAWDDALASPGPETSLQQSELLPFMSLLTDARAARGAWVRWQWWRLTNSGYRQLQQVAMLNALTTNEADLDTLAVRLEKRNQLNTLQPQVESLLSELPLPNVPASLRLIWRARKLLERIDTLPLLTTLPPSAWLSASSFQTVVTAVLNIAMDVAKQFDMSGQWLSGSQLERLWHNNSFADALYQSLTQDFDLLVEHDRIEASLTPVEMSIVQRLVAFRPDQWVTTFQNSLRLAWLNHIEQQKPELRAVSSLKMAQAEQMLQAGMAQKQRFSRDILLMKLREQTYRNLTFNRLNNVVTYRELLHQTTKKRTIWPVRKLVAAYADEVFKLVPCWLASPETVSAIFPLRNDLFDLVIFDEASQCFAEQGVPAMMRGKQVIVTGDNQQLRPSDLYQTRLGDVESGDDTPAELEVESLLELATQWFPQTSLTEHYRSRSLDLITFSNRHFYQNRLSLLPHYADINRHEPAIHYQYVGGVWQQNTNLTEAEAVLQLIDQLAVELPGRSIGVVTFNYPQQQLIQDLLLPSPPAPLPVRERGEPSGSTIPLSRTGRGARGEGIFVKNIENVQGDERDIIIFSVGYAPDERGRLTMQFGSLNARGGENRLNVAVTRARERVYVITSLWPDQLRTDTGNSAGVHLLKAYLQYALDVSEGRFRPLPAPITAGLTGSLLKDQLADKRPNWQPELPFADLTVKVEDTYQSLILTDDDTYYQQPPKQAHAYLPIALQSRGWPFQRVWSREF